MDIEEWFILQGNLMPVGQVGQEVDEKCDRQNEPVR